MENDSVLWKNFLCFNLLFKSKNFLKPFSNFFDIVSVYIHTNAGIEFWSGLLKINRKLSSNVQLFLYIPVEIARHGSNSDWIHH